MSDHPLTPTQSAVLAFIVRWYELEGYPPTIRQIGTALGYSSTATTQSHVKALVEKGYLKGAGRTLQPVS